MNPYSFAILCFGFCSFLIGYFVWLRREDLVGKIYFLFSASISFWALFSGICWSLNDVSPRALFYLRIADIGALLIPPTWLHFSLAYGNALPKHRGLVRFFYILSLVFCFFSFSKYYIQDLRMTSLGITFKEPGILFVAYTIIFFFVVLLGYYFLIRRMLQLKGQDKTRILGFIISVSVGYIGGGLYFLPIYRIEIPQYAIFIMPFYPFAAAYFMSKKGLFDAEELAQAAHRDKLMAIGVLAASINHEVRNPLYVIKGLAESCLERQKQGVFPNDKKALESANDVFSKTMQQADRAMDIIKRLSLFAKSGVDSEIKFENIKIADVLEDVISLVHYELASHNIALSREIPADLPEVRADRRYLEEILFNLIVNAAQATKANSLSKKPGEIKIGAHSENDKLQLEIADNGPGIPEDKIKDVFRPFYTTKEEGTGLGLYITKQLIEKIGGRIDVASRAEEGTAFTVRFPKPKT